MIAKSSIYTFLVFGIIVSGIQCTPNKQSPNQTNKESTVQRDANHHFNADTIGWSFDYPADWIVLKKHEVHKVEKKGEKVIQDDFDEPVKGQTTNLLWLRKGHGNTFSSLLIPYNRKENGSLSIMLQSANKKLIASLQIRGYPFTNNVGSTTIDSLEFHKISETVFTKDKKDTLFNEVLLNRVMNDSTILQITYMYTNQGSRKALYNILESSRFKK